MKNGPYELIIAPGDYPGKKYRDRYCYEHIYVYWTHNGILPPKGHEIHHINGDHRDNRIENLILVTSEEHRNIHKELSSKKAQVKINCANCNKEFFRIKSRVRKTLKRSFNFYCSRKCQYRGLEKYAQKFVSLHFSALG